jgi:hypothetical protein
MFKEDEQQGDETSISGTRCGYSCDCVMEQRYVGC